jgi:hypothetical protein
VQTKGLEIDDLVFFEPFRTLLQVVAAYRAQPNLLEERGGDQNVVLLAAMGTLNPEPCTLNPAP